MPNSSTLLLDENLSWRVSRGLSAAGYQVITAGDAALVGKQDSAVFDFARRHAAIIVTRDIDFLTRFAPPHAGIIVVSCSSQATNAGILSCLLAELPGILADTLTDTVRTINC